MSPPRVLLTNDDGPPDPKESPYVLGLYRHLTEQLGWDVKAEWILLDGTPATCANVALHNLYAGEIDLVVCELRYQAPTWVATPLASPTVTTRSRSNLTFYVFSAAFAISSGTIGAAMSSSLSKKRAIALSYGTMIHPTPQAFFEPAHNLACRIMKHLWENWGEDECGLREGEVDLYSVNIPLIQDILSEDGLKICWTHMWRNSYGRLFKNVASSKVNRTVNPSGPDAIADSKTEASAPDSEESAELLFKWSPDMLGLINPSADALPIGSDGWALHQGWVSVTPLRASFGEPHTHRSQDAEKFVWKMKL
ncbi:hypothetical protein CVT24_011578 [Panaeolus cyanescens]|uniref:Survival protein SurE-like phosphatase/nucleotidase domain-containing protein n=1 Tax=Panaeolus cyanescens TaxID=181874 RepID=A0A409YVA1_9AGAR|nr:hypothetical protein CVT24_011578 [Panaeolus cyanescens]